MVDGYVASAQMVHKTQNKTIGSVAVLKKDEMRIAWNNYNLKEKKEGTFLQFPAVTTVELQHLFRLLENTRINGAEERRSLHPRR
jgi:hypothetical protein